MRYHLLTLALFASAAVLCFLGMRDKLGWLLIAAALPEVLAWKRVFKRRNTAWK
jgi:hypothetical protein